MNRWTGLGLLGWVTRDSMDDEEGGFGLNGEFWGFLFWCG